MIIVKLTICFFIFSASSYIGMLYSKKYTDRVYELQEFRTALNMLKSKIKYTYEPIPEAFLSIAENSKGNISEIFKNASNNMKKISAGKAWELALDNAYLNINLEDKNILKSFSKMLGKTDLTGQISQIELTSNFLDSQINKAEKEKEKNGKLYKTLGIVIGFTLVIVLI